MQDRRWQLIATHQERLLRLARRRCAAPADAEDIVQEAMLRAATFKDLDENRLAPLLTSITVRLCADSYRHADRDTRIVRRLAPDESTIDGPEDAVCQAADADVLEGLLARLPERQRAVLVDRAHGFSLAQIGHRHSLTYKAAESALARARMAMRLALTSTASIVTGTVLNVVRAAARPRRALVAAVPAAVALVVTATLQHVSPYAVPAAPLPGAVRQPVVRTGGFAAGQVVAADPAPDQVAGIRGTAAGKLENSTPDLPDPFPPDEEVARVGPVRITDEDDDDDEDDLLTYPDRYAQRCANEGAWAQVGTPGHDTFLQGCGNRRRPEPDEGSYQVYVDPRHLSPR